MKFIHPFRCYVQHIASKQMLRVMKLILLLMTTLMMQVSASSFAQRITLKENNTNLKNVFAQIRKQTGYIVLYESNLLSNASKVNVNFVKTPLEEVLTSILKDQNLAFEIKQNSIILHKKNPSTEQLKISNPVQQNDIKGKVVDQNGKPIPGVNIIIKGTSKGVSTDENGNFSIALAAGENEITISSIGFESQTIVVNNQTNFNIVLKESLDRMNEVIVVGYGSQQKKTLTTSVSTVRQIKDLPVTSPGAALAGQVSGVSVQSTNGSPGQPPVIRVRGIGSIQAGNGPLYVVDGYPLENATAFNLISPQDILDIQILKDAAAAAIYGSRGGNGVVIVTTKRGEKGPAKISFNSYVGVQQVAKKVGVLNTAQFFDYLKDVFVNQGKPVPNIVANPPANTPNTDWQNEIFHNALQHSYQLGVTGGSDAVRYSVSGGYLSQEGIVDLTKYTRFNLRMSLDAQLTEKLKVGATITPSYTINDNKSTQGIINGGNPEGGGGIAAGGVVNTATSFPSFYPVRYANGDYAQPMVDPIFNPTTIPGLSPNFTNPIASLNLYEDREKTPLFLGSVYAEYNLLKDLKFKTTFGFQTSNSARNVYVPATLGRPALLTASLSKPDLLAVAAQRIVGLTYNWVSENFFSYDKTFGQDHALSAIVGYSAQQNTATQEVLNGQGGTYSNDQVHYVSNAGQIFANTAYNENTLVSVYGRVNYGYMSKYLLSATIRRDGSSRFGTNKKYASFPSISAAWRVSEEKFMKELPAISELKIRASYGLSGNNNIPNYQWQSYQTQVNYIFGAGNGSRNFGYIPSGVTNKDLTWETNSSTDIGLDVGLFHDRVTFTGDYYKRITSDLLYGRGVPALVGFANTVVENIGKVENKGLELAVTGKILTGGLKWTSNANITFNKNKVLQLANANYINISAGALTNSVRLAPGMPFGAFYGYKHIGVYKDQADINSSPVYAAAVVKPGDIKYADMNGDHKITLDDYTYLGSPQPEFTYGFVNTFEFNNFDLNIIMRGSKGNMILNANDRNPMRFNGAVNPRTNVLDRWRSEQEPGNGMEPRVGGVGQGDFSNRFLHDASFLQISNVTLGYNIPASVFKSHIKGLRIYGAVQNLATFSKYKAGFNPEADISNEGASTTIGVDWGSYPIARTFLFGLNLNF